MAEITAKDVKALRDATGAGMMDAKRALTDADGDFEAASQILRERGLAKAATRTDRENVEGAVALVANGTSAALVHLKCETDFSAKSAAFIALVGDMANAVLADGEGAADGFTGALEDLKLTVKENIEVGLATLVEAADGNTLDTYLHVQDGRGVNGVVVEGMDPTDDLVAGHGRRHLARHVVVAVQLGDVTVAESDRLDGQYGPARRRRGDGEVVAAVPGAVAVKDHGTAGGAQDPLLRSD